VTQPADRWRAWVGSVAVLVTVGLLAAATLGPPPAPRPVPAPVPPAPHLVALGDSVAAGFGVGPAGAYPELLAANLDLGVENLARAGACAAPVAGCTSSVLADQVPRITRTPTLVTLTVGANDIHFAECFAALFATPTPNDPCAPAEYRANLATLRSNLARLLDTVHARFPRATVLVSRYYDPLPVSQHDLCGLGTAQFSGGGIADRFVRRVAERLLRERLDAWQARIFQQAATQLAQLNAVIDATGAAHGARVVAVDFAGHDLCAPQPWVFGPDVRADVRFRWAGPDYDEHLAIDGTVRCHAPCGPPTPFSTRFKATVGTLSVDGTLDPNGTPHPDAAGQRALAAAFAAATPRGL
jgi:lysophospholipase L1-like esterase